MDIRVLKSLATSGLYPYLEGADSKAQIHDGGGGSNGAEFPDQVATTILAIPNDGAPAWSAPTYFSAGFDLALEIAAAITEDPPHSPDLSGAIARAKAFLAEAAAEAA